MLALALFPLTAYFAFLTALQFRRCPTLMSGSLDFLLLAWGLFGFVSLGLGKLAIPLFIFSTWGLAAWFFWLCFYFLVTFYAAKLFRSRWVIYRVRREIVLPAMFELARQIDPKAEWCGNVFSMHGLGLQWTVTGDRCGGHLLLVPTDPAVNSPHIEVLRERFAGLCRTLSVSSAGIRWFFLLLTLGFGAVAVMDFYRHFGELIQVANDYWVP